MRYYLVAAIAAMCLPSQAAAWGASGHRITGEIAEEHLSGLARAEIRRILGDESLAEASTWADEMRSDPDPFWAVTANPWHYVTVPPGTTYVEVGAPKEGDAYTALQRFAEVLRDPTAPLEDRQLALRFTIHIIGDLHQPLHAGNGSDRGGNDFEVTYSGESTNLHSVWDSRLVKPNLSYLEHARWLSRTIGPQQVIDWWNPDPLTWIAESAQLRDTIYPEEPTLDNSYFRAHEPTAELRLKQAGIRMAAYLSEIFAQDIQTSSQQP